MCCIAAEQPLGSIAETDVKAVDNVHNIVRQTSSSDCSSVKRLSRKSSGSANGMLTDADHNCNLQFQWEFSRQTWVLPSLVLEVNFRHNC